MVNINKQENISKITLYGKGSEGLDLDGLLFDEKKDYSDYFQNYDIIRNEIDEIIKK